MSKATISQLTMFAIVAMAGTDAQADVPDAAITKCAAIVADADRLSCFDTLAETVSTAAQVSVERRAAAAAAAREAAAAAVEAAKREAAEAEARQVQAFGASVKSADELDEVQANVTAVSQLPRGFQQVTLDNGQVWRQVDGTLLIMRAGDEVILKRGALDSFRMTVKRQRRTVSVRRVL